MTPTYWLLLAACPLLAVERVAYALIWRRPDVFRAVCHRVGWTDPVRVLRWLFVAFKVLQCAVFLLWIGGHGGVQPPHWPPGIAGVIAVLAVATGQTLNVSVFVRLGSVGVFYGMRFGHVVQWCTGFPFSLLSHPQYVGTVLSIWGLFLLTRYPAPDWFLLPLLETAYYVIGALGERVPPPDAATAAPSAPSVLPSPPRPAPLPWTR
jgi:methylene-fatty-acyl-phospholipid synthase